jgi:hypothetical protein
MDFNHIFDGILYPVARDPLGTAVHIDTWQRGVSVTCFGCDQELVGRLPHDGIKPTAHFAHKPDATCSGETALHRAAKSAVSRAHAAGTLHFLSWECPRCRRVDHQTDLSAIVFHEEARPCEGVVSDLLGVDSSGAPRVALEVVVTHDIEIDTLLRYESLDLIVLSFRPSWGILGDVLRGIPVLSVDHRAGLIDEDACTGCQHLRREKAEWAARAERQQATAWWSVWVGTWSYAGREELRRSREQQLALDAQDAREERWWTTWSRVWSGIAEQIRVSWWVDWHSTWRTIGDTHARPVRWGQAWCAVWEDLGRRYVTEEASRVRRVVEDARRVIAQRANWWSTWMQTWTDIGQRESGMRSVWHPVCRQCRQDLTAGHQCP